MAESKMKNRSSLPVALMMGVSLIALTACEEPKVDASVYRSLEQCKSDTDVTADQCEAAFKEATNQHAAVAPKYASQPPDL